MDNKENLSEKQQDIIKMFNDIAKTYDLANRVLSMGIALKKVIILLSDGFTDSGFISVKDAIKYSLQNKIKIYTIGLGKKGDYDENLLKLIAKNSGGKFFNASSADDLREVYAQLNSLEPSPIRSQHYLHKNLLFSIPLFIAIVLFIFILLKRFRLSKWLF